jgi:hypothetical protein
MRRLKGFIISSLTSYRPLQCKGKMSYGVLVEDILRIAEVLPEAPFLCANLDVHGKHI